MSPSRSLLCSLLLACCFLQSFAYKPISDASLELIPEPGDDFNMKDGALLAPILKPRVPGSQGSLEVLQHFIDFFATKLPDWKVELQNSTNTTPATGNRQIPFVNFIATRDPPWSREGHVGRLALTAHYDSLITPKGFIGAIDSAAPCAMILHAARSIDAALTRKWQAMEAQQDSLDDMEEDKGVQIILFDGEEAFVRWTPTDSIYGARALAEHWDTEFFPATSTYHNPTAAISLFLLLDLLGSVAPNIPSYFATTHWAYRAMSELEIRLRTRGLFKSSPNHRSKRIRDVTGHLPAMRQELAWLHDAEKRDFSSPFMGDDHQPFLERGVQVLHMIPYPFPLVWHTMSDDGEHLNLDTTEDWAKLVIAFLAEWLELEGYMDHGQPHLARRDPNGKSEL